MLDIHRLRIFRAVVAAGSINGAASNLGYTPSAISQHLAALQKETGLALVERVGRGIQLTGAGRVPAVVSTLLREFPKVRLDLRLIELGGEAPFVPDVEIYVDGAASSPLGGYDVHALLDEPGAAVLPDGLRAVPVVDPAPVRRIMARVRRSVRDNPAVHRALDLLRETTRP